MCYHISSSPLMPRVVSEREHHFLIPIGSIAATHGVWSGVNARRAILPFSQCSWLDSHEASSSLMGYNRIPWTPCSLWRRSMEALKLFRSVSTVNQVVSKRMVKKQQMRMNRLVASSWTKKGAHLLLQVRTQVLNGGARKTFCRWYPELFGRY